jgi:signal transduction histidine kinase
MSPRKKALLAFASALLLLFVSGIAAYISMVQLLKSERWVSHTREVQADIGRVESANARFGRARVDFVATQDESILKDFENGISSAEQELQALKQATEDNSRQQELCDILRSVTEQRIALARQAIELKKMHPDDLAGQENLTRLSIPLLNQTTAVTQDMREHEEQLLLLREQEASRLSVVTLSVLVSTVLLAFAMLGVHYWLLTAELSARERAEQGLRVLSTRLMHVQDEERRKFSRELHDSLGQYLAALKMTFGMLSANHAEDRRYTDCLSLLDQCISETRTISHLLHPPLLEVAGFSSAARWFVDGFSKRSGIDVKAEIPDATVRLPISIEIALFRVLQEGLTNIHRHSKSSTALIKLAMLRKDVRLTITDFGVGIPEEVLERHNNNGSSGVGLTAMRERIRDIGGDFEIHSANGNTVISVSIPLHDDLRAPSDTRSEDLLRS